jgi:hypothetical protein
VRIWLRWHTSHVPSSNYFSNFSQVNLAPNTMLFFTIHRSWASLACPSRTCSHWIRVRYCHDDFVNILALLYFIYSLCVYGASDIVNGSVKYSSVLDTLLLTGGFKNLVMLST